MTKRTEMNNVFIKVVTTGQEPKSAACPGSINKQPFQQSNFLTEKSSSKCTCSKYCGVPVVFFLKDIILGNL